MAIIGTSDLDVRPLALGGNTFGWTSSKDESFEVLDAFRSTGGNFVDTADVYSAWAPGNSGGESETIIGEWLASRGRRDELVLATKVAQLESRPGLSAENVAAAAEDSLRRLGTDHIDLYYAHQEDPSTPVEESVAAFARLQQEGKIRWVGLSNFAPESIRAWVAAADAQGVARPVALQPHYNLVFRHEFETTYASVCREFELGVMPYFALASGLLTGKYASAAEVTGARAGMVSAYVSDRAFEVIEVARRIAERHGVSVAAVSLAWLAAQDTVVAPIASARTLSQLPALMESLVLTLSAEELAELSAASEGLGA